MAKKSKATTKVRPLYDRVLARRLEPAEEVRGGIIIPDTAKEKPLEAEVVAVGAGRRLEDGTRLPVEVEGGAQVVARLTIGSRFLVGPGQAGSEVELVFGARESIPSAATDQDEPGFDARKAILLATHARKQAPSLPKGA